MFSKNDLRFYFNDDIMNKCESKIFLSVSSENKQIKQIKTFDIFTDGSCFNNGKKNSIVKAGIGVYFADNSIEDISEPLDNNNKKTNNIAEFMACIRAIEHVVSNNLHNGRKIVIYSDSNYVINCVNKWYKNWEKNNFKTKKDGFVKNKNLVIKLHGLCMKYGVLIKYCKAHGIEPLDKSSFNYYLWYGNNKADKLARNGSFQ